MSFFYLEHLMPI